MTETQETITTWMNETFPGTVPESPRKTLRALEEMVELCLAAGATPMEISLATIKALGNQESGVVRAEPDKVPVEAADVLIVLYGVASTRRFDLHEEVDKKMTKKLAALDTE